MPTIVSVGSITIVDVNDGAPGPAVVVTGNRPLNFTATDGVLDSTQPNIVLTAEVFGLASAAYVWTFLGFETSPVSSGTNVQTITMAQFGTSRAASVTCTVNGLYVSQVTIVRAERSTAEAGATVGAGDSNYTGGRGNNLLRNSMLKDSTAGWGYSLGPGCTFGEFRTILNENGAPKGYGALKLGFYGTASSVYESQVYCGDLAVPCVPGERMELGVRVGVYRGDAQLTASFLLADGSFTRYVPVTGGVSVATNQTAWTQNLSDLQHLWGFVTAPANAVKCYMEVRVKRTTTAAPTDLYIALPYIGKAGAAQTVYSPWNQGVFITPSEVTTWIANAALGNAQFGGDLWSTNHVSGSSGWRIYRSGAAEFRNIVARGDIQATSVTANSIYTDSINDGAVTTAAYASSNGFKRYWGYGNYSPADWYDNFSSTSFYANAGDVILIEATFRQYFNCVSGYDNINLNATAFTTMRLIYNGVVATQDNDFHSVNIYPTTSSQQNWTTTGDTLVLRAVVWAQYSGTHTITLQGYTYTAFGKGSYGVKDIVLSAFIRRR